MTEFRIYNVRLLAFAEKLKTAEVSEPFFQEVLLEWPHRSKINYCIAYDANIFRIMQEVSNDWYFNQAMNNWELRDFPNRGTIRSCMEWFGLKPEDFIVLFDIDGGQSCYRFSGRNLHKKSMPSDYAYNIYEFVHKQTGILN